MDFTYVATGGVQVFNCADCKFSITRHYEFPIGSILFIKAKAMKGLYRRVVIKEVRFPSAYVNLYVDTLNALWNEDELVSHQTAIALIQQYTITRHAELEQIVKMC